MMAAMREWLSTRPWWQELLINWLLFSVWWVASTAFFAVITGWTDLVPRNAFKFLTVTFAWSVLCTPLFRWRRRRFHSSSPR